MFYEKQIVSDFVSVSRATGISKSLRLKYRQKGIKQHQTRQKNVRNYANKAEGNEIAQNKTNGV